MTAATLTRWDANAFGFDPERDGILVEHSDEACPELQGTIALEDLSDEDRNSRSVPCDVCILGLTRVHGMVAPDTEYRPREVRKPGNTGAGPKKSNETVLAETEAWLRDLGRKVEVSDVTHAIQKGATLWLNAYTGTFEFLTDVKRKGLRSAPQAKGVLNCWRADLNRQARDTKPVPAPAALAPPAKHIPVDEVGIYILPDGTVVKVQPNKEKTRTYGLRWVELSHVERLNEDGDHVHGEYTFEKGLVSQVATEGRKMTLEEAKAFILRYGKCCRCGRKLKAADSVERGIGPVCINYFG